MSLNEAVMNAIQANLAGAVAGELKTYIADAEKLKEKLTNLEINYNASLDRVSSLDKKLAEYRALDEYSSDLDRRAKELTDKELTLLKREASMDAKEAVAELSGYKACVSQFLKLPKVRTDVLSNVSKPVEGHPGGNGYSPTPGYLIPTNENHTTTRTEE